MDNLESNQLQVLANDLYIIHEKIIKTDALINIVKEKSKRCNKLEKLHKKLLDSHTQLQLKQSESERKLNNCFINHTPLEIELNEIRTRFSNAEALHSDFVNAAELKYQNVCQELENLKKTQFDISPKIKEKRTKKNNRNLTKEELYSKLDDLTIELELTKSELESLNQEITEKDKIINKYEYEKQVLNDKIEFLNNKLHKKQSIKNVTKNTIGVQTDKLLNEVPLVENDFVIDVLPAISELDYTLPILSDSICADIVKSEEKQFTSSYVQTDDFLFISKEQNFKSFGVQTDFPTKTKSFHSFGCQTNIATNCVELQTDDNLWVEHAQKLRREKLKTSYSQTYYDDILNFEDILLEMTAANPILSPLSPNSINENIEEKEDKSNSIAVGPDQIIPIFSDFYCQTDRIDKVDSFVQTDKITIFSDSHENPDKIQLIESNTQTDTQRKIDNTSQTDHHEIINLKPFSSNLLPQNIKMSHRFSETKLKNRLNTPNSKISKKYRTTKNKLLEHLKLSNLDFKQILEKYLSEGNGPTLFISPKILRSSQLNQTRKHQNPFMNINNRSMFQQCNSKPFNLHECPCFNSCNMRPSSTTLQCNISCNGYRGYCNHSHRIKIKHNANEVIVSSDSEEEEYNIRNYYKNKFRKKYKAKLNCKCNEFSNENFYHKLNSLKKEVKTSDTDASINVCKVRKRRRKLIVTSSDSDDSVSQNISSCRDKHKRHKFKNPISQIAQEKINSNSSVTTEKRIIGDQTTKLDSDYKISQNNTINLTTEKRMIGDQTTNNNIKLDSEYRVSQNSNSYSDKLKNSVHTENRIEDEKITNENINFHVSNCDTILNKKLNVNIQKDKNTNLKQCKNIVKPTKEKSSKIKQMRKILNKTSLNYNKSNILTRSMSKNNQIESNTKQSNTSDKRESDLFGSLSDSSSNSNVDENLNKSFEMSKFAESNRTKSNCKSATVLRNTQKQINTNKNDSSNKPEKQFKNSVPPPSLKISRKLENLNTPPNILYKRPERRQIIPIGPLSPEPVSCEFIQPKIIPMEQMSTTLDSNSLGENVNIAKAEILQKQTELIADIIPSSVINSKQINQSNLLHNINVASCSSKQNKVQLQDNRYVPKMISDIVTMDWDKNLMNTVVTSLVNHDALMIAKLIVNEAAIDHAQKLDKSFTPPAPLMAPSQQKLLVLINRLDSEGLTGLKKKVIVLTEKRILSEKYLTNISSLTRIYVALCKLQYDIEGVRMFCCNAAYYLGDLFLPVMFIVLTMWGDILPMASADVPLAITLVQVIQSKTCSTPGYNASTLNRLLSDYYEYKRGEITNDQVMDKLVACFIENPCSSIFISILILCKNLPSKWRFTQLKKHFIPLVDKHKVDQSKSTLISITLILVNRIKDMFNAGNDKEYINELNNWLVKLIANNSNNISNIVN